MGLVGNQILERWADVGLVGGQIGAGQADVPCGNSWVTGDGKAGVGLVVQQIGDRNKWG